MNMSVRLDPGVEQRLESPSSEEVSLIVGVEDSKSDTVIERVSESGATIEEILPCDYIAASISDDNLQELCSLDVVSSVEIEGRGETLETGNF